MHDYNLLPILLYMMSMAPWMVAFVLSTNIPEASPEATATPYVQIQDRPTSEQISALIANQYAAWNAGDIDSYMSIFWQSPLLVYVTDISVWTGWEQVIANVRRQYPDPHNMGNIILERLQTNVLSSDSVTTVEWWTFVFPAGGKTRGFTTSSWRKLSEGWRIVEGHTSALDY